jgi:hypothetical protein
MQNKISIGEEIYAILVPASEIKEGSEWFGSQHESLQASRMKYPVGKSFRVHHHILNPRTIKRTQEAFIVISGKIAVDIYDNPKPKLGWVPQLIGTLEASAGEAIFVYRGGHGVRVLEDSVAYEIKAGQFSYVSEDKDFLND